MWNTASWSAWINWHPSSSRPRTPPMAAPSPSSPFASRLVASQPDPDTIHRKRRGRKKSSLLVNAHPAPSDDLAFRNLRASASSKRIRILQTHVDEVQTKALMVIDNKESLLQKHVKETHTKVLTECEDVCRMNPEENELRVLHPLSTSNRHLTERVTNVPPRRRKKQSSAATFPEESEIHVTEHRKRGGNVNTTIIEASGYIGSPREKNVTKDTKLTSSNTEKQETMQESVVKRWLYNLGLMKYAKSFEIHEVDSEVLPLLTVDDLKDMGISAVGSRRKMLHAIQKLSKRKTLPQKQTE